MSDNLNDINKEKDKELGLRIRRIRREKNLTQKALGQMINKSYEAVRKYENGDRQPPLDVLQKISEALDVSINTFIEDKTFKSSWNLSESQKSDIKKDVALTNAIKSVFEAYGYNLINELPSGFTSEEQMENFYEDKSNLMLNLITPHDKTIPLSIKDWEILYSNFENYIKFELFKLDSMSDK